MSLLNSSLADKYEIDVFTIWKSDYNPKLLASYDIGLNGLSTAFHGDFSTFGVFDKLTLFPIKLLKQIKPLVSELEKWVEKKTIKRIERRKRYDMVVGFQEHITTRFTSGFNCPNKIAWIHCDYANHYGKDVDELSLYSLFSKIVCVSEFTKTGFIERYPSLSEKTFAIHNVFDSNGVITKSKDSIDDNRFDNSLFTIVSLGRVSDVKRFYLIPKISAKLKESNLAFRWYIIGSSDNELELKRVSNAIQEFGVEKEVVLLGSKPNPYPYLNAADLMVTVSRSEACPMIFNEAKLLHVPILSSDFGSAFEFVEQGKDGYITSIEEMSVKLIELINHPETLTHIKNNNLFNDSNARILEQLENLFTI